MRYIPNTPKITDQMLADMKVPSIEALFESIPQAVRLQRPLQTPKAMSEPEELAYFAELAQQNQGAEWSSFMGAGCYDHFIPLTADTLINRAEYFTSYTPYQPEISQGTLQAIFEFQSFVCLLTGLQVANASVYDGATAATEAALMALRLQSKRHKILVGESLHPYYFSVLKTYLSELDVQLETVPFNQKGQVDAEKLQEALDENVAGVLLQQPNFFGVVEPLSELTPLIKQAGAIPISVTAEAMSLAALKPMGECGVEIAVGEAQSLGVPVNYGGPYLGFMAALDQYKRQMPGRIAGKTKDLEGRDGFVLTLSTREQHIRREKATSNICTNQNLVMLMSVMYLTLMGKQGLANTAHQNVAKTQYFKQGLAALNGYALKFDAPVFNELVVQCPRPADEVLQACEAHSLIPGVPLGQFNPEWSQWLLVNLTEKKSKAQIDHLLEALKAVQ